MKNIFLFSILLVAPHITQTADTPQSAAAAARAMPMIDLTEVIERAQHSEDFTGEIKFQLMRFVNQHKPNYKQTLMARNLISSRVDTILDTNHSINSHDLFDIITNLNTTLETDPKSGLTLNISGLQISSTSQHRFRVASETVQEADVNFELAREDIRLPAALEIESDEAQPEPPAAPVAEEEENMCLICHEALNPGDAIVRGRCDRPRHRHKFHSECISTWLNTPISGDLCPKCRQPFFMQQTEADIASAVRSNNLERLNAIIASNPTFDTERKSVAIYYIYQLAHNHPAILERLIQIPELNINAQNIGDENTALIHIASVGAVEDIVMLLNVPGIDVNAQNNYGQTALISAVKHKHDTAVIALLKATGLNPSIADNTGRTAFCHAMRLKKWVIAAAILEKTKTGRGIKIAFNVCNAATAVGVVTYVIAMIAMGRDPLA